MTIPGSLTGFRGLLKQELDGRNGGGKNPINSAYGVNMTVNNHGGSG